MEEVWWSQPIDSWGSRSVRGTARSVCGVNAKKEPFNLGSRADGRRLLRCGLVAPHAVLDNMFATFSILHAKWSTLLLMNRFETDVTWISTCIFERFFSLTSSKVITIRLKWNISWKNNNDLSKNTTALHKNCPQPTCSSRLKLQLWWRLLETIP